MFRGGSPSGALPTHKYIHLDVKPQVLCELIPRPEKDRSATWACPDSPVESVYWQLPEPSQAFGALPLNQSGNQSCQKWLSRFLTHAKHAKVDPTIAKIRTIYRKDFAVLDSRADPNRMKNVLKRPILRRWKRCLTCQNSAKILPGLCQGI